MRQWDVMLCSTGIADKNSAVTVRFEDAIKLLDA